MIDVDGVVLRLVELVDDSHAAACLLGSREYRQAEHLLIHRLRAGEGEHQSARTHCRYALGIKPLVAAQGILDGVAVLGKSRWVEDNQVVCIRLSEPTQRLSDLRQQM